MPKIGMEPLRRKALIDATISAIGERGSLDVTMSDIAGRAGVSSALAHHYFGAKDELLQATMRHLLAELDRRHASARWPRPARRASASRPSSPSISPTTQFQPETIAAWLAFYVEAQKSPALRRLLRVYARRLHSNLMSGLTAAAAARRGRPRRRSDRRADRRPLYPPRAEGRRCPMPASAIALVEDYRRNQTRRAERRR